MVMMVTRAMMELILTWIATVVMERIYLFDLSLM